MNTSRVSIAFSSIIGKIFSVIGYGLAIFGGIIFLVAIADGWWRYYSWTDDLIMIMGLFVLPGALFIFLGIRIKRRIRRFRVYVSLISSGTDSLDAIAGFTGKTTLFVINDIQKMIRKRYFSSATIDLANNRVVIFRPGASAFPFHPAHGQAVMAQPVSNHPMPNQFAPYHPMHNHSVNNHPMYGHPVPGMPNQPLSDQTMTGMQPAASFAQPVVDVYNCQGCGAAGTKQGGSIVSCEYCGSHIK